MWGTPAPPRLTTIALAYLRVARLLHHVVHPHMTRARESALRTRLCNPNTGGRISCPMPYATWDALGRVQPLMWCVSLVCNFLTVSRDVGLYMGAMYMWFRSGGLGRRVNFQRRLVYRPDEQRSEPCQFPPLPPIPSGHPSGACGVHSPDISSFPTSERSLS